MTTDSAGIKAMGLRGFPRCKTRPKLQMRLLRIVAIRVLLASTMDRLWRSPGVFTMAGHTRQAIYDRAAGTWVAAPEATIQLHLARSVHLARRRKRARVDIEYSGRERSREQPDVHRGEAVLKKLAVAAICLAFLCGSATGAGCKDRDRQCAKGIGRSEIHHVFRIGEGCGIPAMRSQLHRHDLPGNARSDAADQQLRPRHRSHGPRVAAHGSDEQHRGRRLNDGDCLERFSSRSRRSRRMSRNPGPAPWSSTSRPGVF